MWSYFHSFPCFTLQFAAPHPSSQRFVPAPSQEDRTASAVFAQTSPLSLHTARSYCCPCATRGHQHSILCQGLIDGRCSHIQAEIITKFHAVSDIPFIYKSPTMFLGPSWINLARSMSDPGLGGLRRTQGLTQAVRFQEPSFSIPAPGVSDVGLRS